MPERRWTVAWPSVIAVGVIVWAQLVYGSHAAGLAFVAALVFYAGYVYGHIRRG
jgi:hypothetical protein